ncbi:mitochondrial ribosome-associated GTPase 1 [Lingula anatina]|uniref:Mitochondrial ribosome-associated GTPase 1 n=1 Tax=Lingula anatina TaxID=7574 RepID=A0A1S3HAS8_LINAN|nr:mitochondrial ribosome-associated GTPase 1 [Lingula anatina]|eukprot:XP_013383113.1 mitochondrial ribosome-associated GTPase 1 [Lingula anatina]
MAQHAKVFRHSFDFALKDVKNWFPGHMAKGLKALQGRVKDADCIIEVHDARIPFSGRNKVFGQTLMIRPHILLLNKKDLADMSMQSQVVAKLKEEGMARVLFTNCKDQYGSALTKKLIPAILDVVEEYPRYNRSEADELKLLVIGVPNVGKSSLINSLRRMHIKGKKGKATSVGGVAGVTRSLMEKIKHLEADLMAKHAKVFRHSFDFALKDVKKWFPGHMAKGLKALQGRVKDADCIIEVHDARIPFSGRNKVFGQTLMIRPHILLLNKKDLADMSMQSQVVAKLKEEGMARVLFTNCKDQYGSALTKKLIPTILDVVEEYPRYNRSEADELKLLVIGVPNVGKSSLINSLRRMHIKGKKGKATSVGGVAGVTRSLMEKIKVCEDPLIYLYDSPGILQPNIKDVEVGMKLALCATVQDHLIGEVTIVDYMLFWLNKHGYFTYVKHFELDEPVDDVKEFLAHIARKHKKILKQKSVETNQYVYRLDFQSAAVIALKAFRQGKLGKFTLDEDIIPC